MPPGGVWRDGTRVTVARHSTFPRRCFKCNAAADGEPLQLLLTWVPPAERLGTRSSRAAATRTVFVRPYVCADHRPAPGRFRLAARVVTVVAAASLFAGIGVVGLQRRGDQNGYLIALLLVGGMVGLLVAYLLDGWTGGFNLMAATYVGDDGATIVGCGGEFIATLPSIVQAREGAARAEAARLSQLAGSPVAVRPRAPAGPVQFPCPTCGKVYELDAAYVAAYGGQQSDCDQCGRAFTIPTALA
ncbi:MAG TPA: hypothetical protein VF796_22315 [Humisphaera sp.]